MGGAGSGLGTVKATDMAQLPGMPALQRANTAVVLPLGRSGRAECAVGAVVVDMGRALGAGCAGRSRAPPPPAAPRRARPGERAGRFDMRPKCVGLGCTMFSGGGDRPS